MSRILFDSYLECVIDIRVSPVSLLCTSKRTTFLLEFADLGACCRTAIIRFIIFRTYLSKSNQRLNISTVKSYRMYQWVSFCLTSTLILLFIEDVTLVRFPIILVLVRTARLFLGVSLITEFAVELSSSNLSFEHTFENNINVRLHLQSNDMWQTNKRVLLSISTLAVSFTEDVVLSCLPALLVPVLVGRVFEGSFISDSTVELLLSESSSLVHVFQNNT